MSRSTPTVLRISVLLTCGLGLAHRSTAQVSYSVDKTFSYSVPRDIAALASHVGDANTFATGALPDNKTSDKYPGTPVAFGGTSNIFAFSIGPEASALAVSTASVNVTKNDPLVPANDIISGALNVHGTTIATPPKNGAHADSSSAIRITGLTDKAGQVQTNNFSTINSKKILSTDQNKGVIKDPMYIEVFDLDTGDLFKDILFDFQMSLIGEGDVDWDEDGLDIDATDFTFNYDLTSAFLAAKGLINFEITDGVVTKSVATGILTGLLPSVGSTGAFHLNLSSLLTLNYDLGDFGGRRVALSFVEEASGSADIVAVPEPGTTASGIALAGLCLVRFWRRRK